MSLSKATEEELLGILGRKVVSFGEQRETESRFLWTGEGSRWVLGCRDWDLVNLIVAAQRKGGGHWPLGGPRKAGL